MQTLLQPRVSTHHRALSAAFEKHNLSLRRVALGWYGRMLAEDLENRRYAYNMRVSFEGVDYQRGNEVIRNLLQELNHHRREDTSTLVARLISTVVRDHMMYGRCLFELFLEADGDSTLPHLAVLPGWSLKHRWRRTFQAATGASGLRWLRLPRVALVEFRLPGALGKELYRTASSLQILGANLLSNDGLLTTARSTGYDFTTHRRKLDEMTARATRIVGWDGRALFLDRATNSYRTYRQLRFLRTWLVVVRATIEALNSICEHPAVNRDSPFTITVTGLPTIEDVERNMDAVVGGSKSLDDIFSRILHPRSS